MPEEPIHLGTIDRLSKEQLQAWITDYAVWNLVISVQWKKDPWQVPKSERDGIALRADLFHELLETYTAHLEAEHKASKHRCWQCQIVDGVNVECCPGCGQREWCDTGCLMCKGQKLVPEGVTVKRADHGLCGASKCRLNALWLVTSSDSEISELSCWEHGPDTVRPGIPRRNRDVVVHDDHSTDVIFDVDIISTAPVWDVYTKRHPDGVRVARLPALDNKRRRAYTPDPDAVKAVLTGKVTP